jgi:pSer/pThr/pTyr-binding forkhead associated (FHA) protein
MLMQLKRFIALYAVLTGFYHAMLNAQPAMLHRTDTRNYPEIEVVFHDRNPKPKTNSDFRLLENKQEREFTLEQTEDSTGGTREILILLEYPQWSEYRPQIAFFINLLEKHAAYLAGKGSSYRLATFDWTRADGKVLQWIQQDPGDDPNELKRLLKSLPPPKVDARKEHSTEIYPALSEAMDFMGTLPKENAKAILVLSAEFSNIYNDKFDDAELIADGRRKDIPVYALRYPRMSQKYNLVKVCDGTYGLHHNVDPVNTVQTDSLFKSMLDAIVPRSHGREYTLRFTSSQTKDAGMQAELLLSSAESMVIRWQNPGLIETINRRPWLWSLLMLPVLVLGWLFVHFRKKRQQREALFAREQEARIDALRREGENERTHQEAIREQEKKRAEAAEKAAKEQARYVKLRAALHSLQRTPRLVNATGQSLPITEPEWRIGRSEGNALIVDNPGVSREHARILFGACPGMPDAEAAGRFFIQDLQSSNGTLHNGRLLQRPAYTELRSGDAIGIGGQQWFFYL